MKRKSKYYLVDPKLICFNIGYLLIDHYNQCLKRSYLNNGDVDVYISTFGHYFNNNQIKNEESDMIINLLKNSKDFSNYIIALESMRKEVLKNGS